MIIIKNCLIDFILFSLIEGYIFSLFFEKIGNCKKFKWWQIIIMSMGNCIISQIFPPTIYQIIMIFWMFIIICIIEKNINKKYILLPINSFTCTFIIEITYSILLNEFLSFDRFYHFNNIFTIFLFSIPLKILEIILIRKGCDVMKAVFGGIVRK